MRARTLILQAAGGAIASYLALKVMNPVTSYLYEHEDRAARKKEDEARGGQIAYEIAAEKMAKTVGKPLTNEQKQTMGIVMHNLIGLSAGISYAILRKRFPFAKSGYGLLYGIAFFLLVDEGLNTLIKLTPPPQAFPWQAHARGVAGHLAFGVASEAALRIFDRAEQAIAA